MEWISTKEKMPDNDERVILYTPYEIFGDDHACIGNSASISSCRTQRGGRRVPVFTHWMPLPGLPSMQG